MSENVEYAISQYSIDEMYQLAQTAKIDCRIFTSDTELDNLFNFLANTSDLCKNPMETNIVTDNNVNYFNCEINQLYEDNGKNKWDKYKVIIFPDVNELIKEKVEETNEGIMVGFIQFNYEGILNCVVPLATIKKYPTNLHLSEVYAKEKNYPSPHILDPGVSNATRNMLYFIKSIWNVIQLAPTDPVLNDLIISTKTKKITTCRINTEKLKQKRC